MDRAIIAFALSAAVLGSADRAVAGEESPLSPIEALLRHEIIGKDLPLAEVRAFAEARVPAMPAVTSAADWPRQAFKVRSEVHSCLLNGCLGWLSARKVEWLGAIPGGPGYRIKKLRYEAVPGMWIPALLYEPERLSGRVPVVLNVNGHEPKGKQVPYKQIRCINQAKRGMLALNVEWLGMGQLATEGFRHSRMNQLDLCGTSGVAPFFLAMSNALDLLLSLEHADPDRVAVAGLSGGGWQTIIISSLDTRVTLANPVAGYSSFRTRARHPTDLGDSEQTPVDLATVADYTHLTALRAPRPTLLTYNAKDECCFAAAHALPPLVEAARPIFALLGAEDRLRTHINYEPGTHNFEKENREALYRAIGDFFYGGDPAFNAAEIPCDGEIKSKEELEVELPSPNEDFNSLAIALAATLPRDPRIPEAEGPLRAWRQGARAKLVEIVRAVWCDVQAEEAGREERGGIRAVYWRLRAGGTWTVPAVELVRAEGAGEPKGTVVLIADAGRGSAAARAAELLEAGKRVVAADCFYLGESAIRERDYLYALLVSCVGSRPIGIQASQLGGIARWLARDRKLGPVGCCAIGPRSSAFALIAATLDSDAAIAGLALEGALTSLKEVIAKNWTFEQAPELFCFGLLEAFDLEQLAAAAAPRPIAFR